MTRVAEVQKLAKLIDSELGPPGPRPSGQTPSSPAAVAKRRVFAQFAALWCAAEEANDEQALTELKALRPQLKVRPARAGSLAKAFMVFRLALCSVVLFWGSLCVITLAPLRLLHPMLRSAGVPNGMLPIDVVAALVFRAVLASAGIKVIVKGSAVQTWGNSGPGIIAYNHASNLDPFLLNWACREISPKYVGKTSVFKIPLFGWLSLILGMVPINRGDREKAVATMNQTVAGIMRQWGRCVAIAPEGTRTTDGHLNLPFKKGIFHLQALTKTPLLPVVVHGAFELWPPSELFTRTGEVTVTFLPPLPMKEGEGSREASRVQLQRVIAAHMGEHPELTARPLSPASQAENLCILLLTAFVYFHSYRFYGYLMAVTGITGWGVLGLLALVTVVVSVLVDKFM